MELGFFFLSSNWKDSDELQFYASVSENQLYSQDPYISTSVLITVLACL